MGLTWEGEAHDKKIKAKEAQRYSLAMRQP